MNLSRAAGVLLPIFSLPGPFNIGCFGNEAVDFARLLRAMDFTYWQILPLNPPAAGDSPYQCYSAFAGNPLLIDLRQLVAEGLLKESDLAALPSPVNAHQCDYIAAAAVHDRMLRLAYVNCPPARLEKIKSSVRSERPQVLDYALFTAIREANGGLCWNQWPDEGLRLHEERALARFEAEHAEAIGYQLFCQYWFFHQWLELRAAVNALGIRIVGDLPIYVAYDSSDVWANPEQFELDDDLLPLEVSGVPPDYFTIDGQLWGNPLFNWDYMAVDGFSWWNSRICASFELFDIMRLDHFRGFVDYWAVPYGSATARNGRWRPGPGIALLDSLRKASPHAVLIAEDLGAFADTAVEDLREKVGLPGMRILQFAFDYRADNVHLPHNYCTNSVIYSGTHDNQTLLGWLWEADEKTREYGLQYVGLNSECNWGEGGPRSPVIQEFLRIIWQSVAHTVIVPVQDMLGYGSDTRINTPGQASGQWRWRVTEKDLNLINKKLFRSFNKLYWRANSTQPLSAIPGC